MINIDLNKALHPGVFDVLVAFVPGLFLEIAVLLADPLKVHCLVGCARLDRYTTIFVALFVAFVAGNALMLWIRFIQIQMFNVYLLVERLRENKPSPAGQSKMFSFLRRPGVEQAFRDDEITGVQKAFGRAADTLLTSYGIAVPKPPDADEWKAWTQVVGLHQTRDYRGFVLVMAVHATGWSGLAAMYFAPALRTWPFCTFCLFPILYGFLHDRELARSLTDPVRYWTTKLYRLVEEIAGLRKPSP